MLKSAGHPHSCLTIWTPMLSGGLVPNAALFTGPSGPVRSTSCPCARSAIRGTTWTSGTAGTPTGPHGFQIFRSTAGAPRRHSGHGFQIFGFTAGAARRRGGGPGADAVAVGIEPSSSVPGTQSVASNGRSCGADDAVVAHNVSSASSSWIPRPAAVAGVGSSAASQWAGTPPLDKWVVGRRPSTHL
jgi:hypothetical protein